MFFQWSCGGWRFGWLRTGHSESQSARLPVVRPLHIVANSKEWGKALSRVPTAMWCPASCYSRPNHLPSEVWWWLGSTVIEHFREDLIQASGLSTLEESDCFLDFGVCLTQHTPNRRLAQLGWAGLVHFSLGFGRSSHCKPQLDLVQCDIRFRYRSATSWASMPLVSIHSHLSHRQLHLTCPIRS